MPSWDEEAPRLAEIGRMVTTLSTSLADFRSEMRGNFERYVTKERYDVEAAAFREKLESQDRRIKALEDHSRTMKQIVYSGIATVVVSLVATLVLKGM